MSEAGGRGSGEGGGQACPPARPGARGKARPSLAFAVVVAVLVAAIGVEAFLLLRPKQTARPSEAEQAIAASAGANETTTFGNPKAPIKVEFYAPLSLPWHQKTIGLLRDYDKKHRGQIFVKLMWQGNSEADAEMVQRGFVCAVIFINGKHEFTLPNGKQVDLQKRPNNGDASFYNSEDVITILEQMRTARASEAEQAIPASAGANATTTFGDPKAPIKVELYAPLTLPWHQKTIGLLRDYDKKHRGQIFVKLMWQGNSEADAEMVQRGFVCAVIFINGKHEFTLPNGKQVDLQKRPNNGDASFYNSEDVITILEQMEKGKSG